MAEDFVDVLALLRAPGERGFLATLVATEGSSYRRPGARLAGWTDGRSAGGISGGCLEADIRAHGQEVASTGKGKLLEYRTDSDGEPLWGTGTGCDGTVWVVVEPLGSEPHALTQVESGWREGRRFWCRLPWRDRRDWGSEVVEAQPEDSSGVFFEELSPPLELWVFGVGDDALPLIQGAALLGWRIHAFDTRGALLAAKRVAPAEPHLLTLSGKVTLPRAWGGAAIVVMSHRFGDDLGYLRILEGVGARYLGVLGPRRRAEKLVHALTAGDQGAAEAWLNRLHAPAGLHLGGDGPRSVALSILAEIQSLLHGGERISHRERGRPIH